MAQTQPSTPTTGRPTVVRRLIFDNFDEDEDDQQSQVSDLSEERTPGEEVEVVKTVKSPRRAVIPGYRFTTAAASLGKYPANIRSSAISPDLVPYRLPRYQVIQPLNPYVGWMNVHDPHDIYMTCKRRNLDVCDLCKSHTCHKFLYGGFIEKMCANLVDNMETDEEVILQRVTDAYGYAAAFHEYQVFENKMPSARRELPGCVLSSTYLGIINKIERMALKKRARDDE